MIDIWETMPVACHLGMAGIVLYARGLGERHGLTTLPTELQVDRGRDEGCLVHSESKL